jgi:hypothetical protein
MVTRLPSLLTFARAARAAWWCGLPLLFLAYVVLGPEFYQFEPLYGVANSVWPISPLAAELIAQYPLWMIAMLLVTAAMLWSHYRGAALVRIESLALPAYIGGIEACDRVVAFLGCRGGSRSCGAAAGAVCRRDGHRHYHDGSSTPRCDCQGHASPHLSGSFSRRSLLPVLAAIAAVTLQLMMYDLILRNYVGPAPQSAPQS